LKEHFVNAEIHTCIKLPFSWNFMI